MIPICVYKIVISKKSHGKMLNTKKSKLFAYFILLTSLLNGGICQYFARRIAQEATFVITFLQTIFCLVADDERKKSITCSN